MKLKNNDLNKGIWSVTEKYKANYEFLKSQHKKYNNITQIIEKFKNNKLFCFKFETLEGYIICTPGIKKDI